MIFVTESPARLGPGYLIKEEREEPPLFVPAQKLQSAKDHLEENEKMHVLASAQDLHTSHLIIEIIFSEGKYFPVWGVTLPSPSVLLTSAWSLPVLVVGDKAPNIESFVPVGLTQNTEC